MKIEKNVPLPTHIKKRFRLGALPLADMSVGDSLFIEVDLKGEELQRVLHSLRVRLNRFTKANPKYKFSSSHDEKNGGLRIWRR